VSCSKWKAACDPSALVPLRHPRNDTPRLPELTMTSNSAEATALAPTSRPDLSTTTRSHALVASFLASQGYTDTLAAFKRECSDQYEVDGEDEPKEVLDLREVVEEFLTTRMKSVAIAPAPLEDKLDTMVVKMALPDRISRTIRLPTNVLSVSPGSLPARNWDPTVGLFKRCVSVCPCAMIGSDQQGMAARSLPAYSYPMSNAPSSCSRPRPSTSSTATPSPLPSSPSPSTLLATRASSSLPRWKARCT
jgi:hypothetical protein